LKFGGIGIDRDDAAGAGDLRAVDRGHADAAAANHHHALAGRDFCGIDHRAVAGDDAATDQRGKLQRHVLADFDDRILVHQHLLGERRQVEKLVQLFGRAQDSRLDAPGSIFTDVSVHSTGRPVVQLSQVPQKHRQAGHDMIAGFYVIDVGADLLDDAGRLVAEHAGSGCG
jgi:hypothetical protein